MTDPRPLTPQARLRRALPGRTIRLAEATWSIPYAVYARAYDQIRDRMYESIAGRGTVARADIVICAHSLLCLQYDLSEEEVHALLGPVDPTDLTEAVLACLMGEDDPLRSYSNWVRTSLIINNLDPDKIHPTELPVVMFQLEALGRIVPLQSFSHIEIRKNKIARLLANR